jgi:hypothetical protein
MRVTWAFRYVFIQFFILITYLILLQQLTTMTTTPNSTPPATTATAQWYKLYNGHRRHISTTRTRTCRRVDDSWGSRCICISSLRYIFSFLFYTSTLLTILEWGRLESRDASPSSILRVRSQARASFFFFWHGTSTACIITCTIQTCYNCYNLSTSTS